MKFKLIFFILNIFFINKIYGIYLNTTYLPYRIDISWYSNNKTVKNDCIGLFIASQWVLTEGNCAQFQNAELYRMFMGITNDSVYEIERRSTYYIPHPKYNTTDKMANLALIRTLDRIPFTETISNIGYGWSFDEINEQDDNPQYYNIYGILNQNNKIKVNIEKVEYITNEVCDNLNLTPSRLSNQFCVKILNFTYENCQRLPGSTMIYSYFDYFDTVVGIGTYDVCQNNGYMIYTSTFDEMKWINAVAGLGYA